MGVVNGFVSPYSGLAVDALLFANLYPMRCLNLEMNQSQLYRKKICSKMRTVNVVRLKEQDLLSQMVLHLNSVFAVHYLNDLGKVS